MISLVPPLLSRTALLFLLTATGAATAARPAADIILHNGNIITLNDAQPQASALAISGSRIVAIGDDTATNEWRGDHTRTIDLQGKTVIPRPDRYPHPRHSRRTNLDIRNLLVRQPFA